MRARVSSLIRPSVENAREMVADETPTTLASSLEVICFFTRFTILASLHQDLPIQVRHFWRQTPLSHPRDARIAVQLPRSKGFPFACTNCEKTLHGIVHDFNLFLEKAGISTEQPKTWAELLDRAKEIKAKTGAYGLLFPAGATWGIGSFEEGFRLLIVGTSTPQIASEDGKLNLTGQGIKDSFGFYADLIKSDLMPIQPLLEPEPWVVPKYEIFPAGKLVATTGGSWGYTFMTGVRRARTRSRMSLRSWGLGRSQAKREGRMFLSTSTV